MRKKSKKSKAKVIKLFDPVYESHITCFVGSRDEIIEGIYKEFNITNKSFVEDHVRNIGTYAEFMVFKANDDPNIKTQLVWFDEKEFREDCAAHEFIHVASTILRNRGIPHTEDTEEAYAYLIGYFIREFYRKLRRK